MSARRVARRIASMTERENPCGHAVRVLTLATKVFHCLFQSFSSDGDGRRVASATDEHVASLTGVRLCIWPGGARRLASSAHSSATPLAVAALVTKGRKGGIE